MTLTHSVGPITEDYTIDNNKTQQLIGVLMLCALLVRIVIFWMPSRRYKSLEVVMTEAMELYDEVLQYGVLQDVKVLPIELMRSHAALRARILAAHNYKWFPKTMILEAIRGLSLQLYQCEKQFRDFHVDLANRLIDTHNRESEEHIASHV